MTQSLLKLAGLDSKVPKFSTVNYTQKYVAATVMIKMTMTALFLLVTSTGITMLSKGV
ncbi:transposase [Janthinobacterium sp. Ant5-2-1]|uniref:transposase n=1 Tax=Janthinobacterium sp. Ant5-2-1 TaxID=1755239 RepID=UPI000B171EB4